MSPLLYHLHSFFTFRFSSAPRPNVFSSLYTYVSCRDISDFLKAVKHLHLGGASPPGLVPEGETAQALSLGHTVLPGALVLPSSDGGRFVLQLGQMLHAAVDLFMSTTNIH